MIIVDFIVAFAFFVFISIFYKRVNVIVSEFFKKYSYSIEKSLNQKKQLYEKKHYELNASKYDNQLQKEIDNIVCSRKKRVNDITSTYKNIEKKYSNHIEEKILSIKNHIYCDSSYNYQVQKKYVNSHVKFDLNKLLLKFANLYKKRHNTD